MKFDMTITLGTVIHLVGMSLMIIGIYISLKTEIQDLKTKMDLLLSERDRVFSWLQQLQRDISGNKL